MSAILIVNPNQLRASNVYSTSGKMDALFRSFWGGKQITYKFALIIAQGIIIFVD